MDKDPKSDVVREFNIKESGFNHALRIAKESVVDNSKVKDKNIQIKQDKDICAISSRSAPK